MAEMTTERGVAMDKQETKQEGICPFCFGEGVLGTLCSKCGEARIVEKEDARFYGCVHNYEVE